MKKVQFLRHAESTANAGVPTANPSDIPLTEAGRQAAETAAMSFAATPDLIVVSPYRRTRETATPFRARFPSASVEEWLVHEFSYLSPERCGNSTQMDRAPLVEAYWRAAAPETNDGPGTESFQEFMDRVETARRRHQQRPENTILVVSHEMFIKAAMWEASQGADYASPDAMRRFREFISPSSCPISVRGAVSSPFEEAAGIGQFLWWEGREVRSSSHRVMNFSRSNAGALF